MFFNLVDEYDAVTFLVTSYICMNEDIVTFGGERIEIEDNHNLSDFSQLVERAQVLFNELGKNPLEINIKRLMEFINSTSTGPSVLLFFVIVLMDTSYQENSTWNMLEMLLLRCSKWDSTPILHIVTDFMFMNWGY